jgi:hypothetical protein
MRGVHYRDEDRHEAAWGVGMWQPAVCPLEGIFHARQFAAATRHGSTENVGSTGKSVHEPVHELVA